MFYDGDDDEVKVNGQYKCDILLSQQMFAATKTSL